MFCKFTILNSIVKLDFELLLSLLQLQYDYH